MPVMIWWKCEIIKLLRRPAACVYSFVFAVTNLCHEASRGQAVIYTNSLPPPFLDLGVITWEQNGFISFNPAAAAICTGNICSCGVCTVKQLETSKSLKYKQGRAGNNQNKIFCVRQYYLSIATLFGRIWNIVCRAGARILDILSPLCPYKPFWFLAIFSHFAFKFNCFLAFSTSHLPLLKNPQSLKKVKRKHQNQP